MKIALLAALLAALAVPGCSVRHVLTPTPSTTAGNGLSRLGMQTVRSASEVVSIRRPDPVSSIALSMLLVGATFAAFAFWGISHNAGRYD